MKLVHLLATSAALAALLIFPTAEAIAQSRPVGGVMRTLPPPPPPLFEFNTGFPGLIVVEREVPVIVERKVVHEVKPAEPVAPPPPPRKPYVIGNSYASLPGGCMKMIEGSAAYYFCGGGEWYRQTGSGRSARYQAVARKL